MWFTFRDLSIGDNVIISDFVSFCNKFEVWDIVRYGDTIHVYAKRQNSSGTYYTNFCVNDLDYTHVYLDDGRAVYTNSEDFIEDCEIRRDRIKEFKEQIIGVVK